MEHALDIFNNDAFSVMSLTRSVNKVPNMYGLLKQLGIFIPNPIDTTIVGIEVQEGVLNLVPPTERGGPGTPNKRSTRDMRQVKVPHFALEDQVTADDVQGVRAFGSGNRLLGVAEKVTTLQEQMAKKLYLTQEFMRNGALNGQILDAYGNVLLDLWDLFGIEQKEVDFELDTAGTEITEKCLEVKRHIEEKLQGEQMTKVMALCSPGFWTKFITHESVKEAYRYYVNQPSPLRSDVRSGFDHQEILWREYAGKAVAYSEDGQTATTRVFIPADSAIFLPLGTFDTFEEVYSPADYIPTVNTMGLPLYSSIDRNTKHQKGVDLEVQTNVLPIVKRPEVLVKGTK